MNARKSHCLPGWLIIAFGLVVLLSVPVLAQDSQEQEESASWREKMNTTGKLQQQFDDRPVLFFAVIFFLGVATSLTPCVLPMIPITVSIIAGSKQSVAGQSWHKSALAGLGNSLVYVLGVSTTYALLGVLVATLTDNVMFVRSTLQGPLVQGIIGVLFVVLGASMTGLFSLPIPGWGHGTAEAVIVRQKTKRSLLSVFVLGLVSGIIASPCATPVIGALLAWISTAGVWLGWWTLFVYGWGMGLLLIVAGVSGWSISGGKWMLTVKVILGLLLVLMGVWIVIQGIRGQPLLPVSWLG